MSKSVGEFQCYFKVGTQDIVPVKQAISQLLESEAGLLVEVVPFSLGFRILDEVLTSDYECLHRYFYALLRHNLSIIRKEPTKSELMRQILLSTQLADVVEIMERINKEDKAHYLGEQGVVEQKKKKSHLK